MSISGLQRDDVTMICHNDLKTSILTSRKGTCWFLLGIMKSKFKTVHLNQNDLPLRKLILLGFCSNLILGADFPWYLLESFEFSDTEITKKQSR